MMAEREVVPVFYEVSGVLDTRKLCTPSQLRQILDKLSRDGVQVQLKGNQFCITGSLNQVIQFEKKVRQASQAIQVFGDIDDDALKFLKEILGGKRKQEPATVETQRSLQNKHYKLIPFLLALAKNHRKISKKAKAVSIYRKEATDEEKHSTIRIGFQGAKIETDQLITYIQGFYEKEDDSQPYLLKKVAGSPTLKDFVRDKCLAKFKPTLLVQEKDDIYVVVSQTQCEKCEKWIEKVISSEMFEDYYQKEIQKVLLEYTVDGRLKEQNHGVDEDPEDNHHTAIHGLQEDTDVTKNERETSKEKDDLKASVRNRKIIEAGESMERQNHAEDTSFEGDHNNSTRGFDENTAVTQQGTTKLFKEEEYVSKQTRRPGSSVANRTKPTQSKIDESSKKQYHGGDQSSEDEDYFDETTGLTKKAKAKELCKEGVKKKVHSTESSKRNRRNSSDSEPDKNSNQKNYTSDQDEHSAGSDPLRDNSEEDMDYGQHDDEVHDQPVKFVLDPNSVLYIETFCKETVKQLEGKHHVKLDFSRQSEGTILLKKQKQEPISEMIRDAIGEQMQEIYDDLITREIGTRSNVLEHIEDISNICRSKKVVFDTFSAENKIQLMGQKGVIQEVALKISELVGKQSRKLVRSFSEKSPSSPTDHSPIVQNLNATIDPRSHHAMPQAMAYQHKKTKVVIHTQLGDITKVTVDAIVNAANRELRHFGGLARAIVVAGGNRIQKECDDYIKNHGVLHFKKVCVTSSGKLPCDKVFHVVGPRYFDYNDDGECAKVLRGTFKAILLETAKQKLASVAIPSVSSGVYGVPLYLVADCIAQVIDEYLQEKGSSTSIKEIHLVDINPDMIHLLQKQMNSLVDKGQYEPYTPGAAIAAVHTGKKAGKENAGVTPERKSEGANGAKPKVWGKPGKEDTHGRKSYAESVSSKGSTDRGAIPKKPGTGGTDAAARSSQKNVSNGRGPKADTAASASSPNSQMLNKPDEPEEEDCCICMCPVTNPKTLKCKHTFCTECIDRGFKIKPACPVCGTIYGKITGNQPKNGSMNHTKSSSTKLPGYESCGAIIISYSFPSGTQTEEHDHPGRGYSGTNRTAYLPNNKEGQHVLKLLQEAFKARLVFTVGSSRTTGLTDTVTWNDIHHKTNVHGGPQRFGYPDNTYLKRVKEELAAKGIK